MRRALAFVAVVLVGCGGDRRGFQELREIGYQDLTRGRLDTALSAADEGVARARRQQEPLWEWRFQVLRAEILVAQGRHAEVLTLVERANRSATAEAADVRALVAGARARCLSAEGDDSYRRAAADLAEASRISEALRSEELASEVALCRGTCATFQDDVSAAEAHLREALRLARRGALPFLEARAAGGLGLIRVRTGRYDDATEWLQRSLTLATEIGAEATIVKTQHNLGWCYYKLGDYERALGLLSEGESLAEARGLRDDLHRLLTTKGNVHYSSGNHAEAAHAYRRALGIARELGDRGHTADHLSNLGIIAIEQGRYDEAARYVEEAALIDEEVGNQEGQQHSLLAEGRIRAGRGDPVGAEAALRQLDRAAPTDPELLWLTRAELAELYARTGRPQPAETEFRRAFAVMEASRDQIREAEHKISFFSSLARFYDSYVGFLVDGRRVAEAIELADRSRARLLREMPGPGRGEVVSARRFREVAAGLDAVLLLYWMAPGRSFLWVVTPHEVDLHVLPDEGEIRSNVERHQELVLQSRDPLAEGAKEATWLYHTLVGPAQAAIRKGARVVVVPDGPLHQVNLETLVVPGTEPRYWIEDVTLIMAPSLSLLAASRNERRPGQAPSILLIGDSLSPSEEFPPLPHAAREVERIAEQFAPARRTVYSGARANPSIYKAADPGRYSFIHFATHAKANPLIPLDSAVILSAKDDTYKLYAREIADVPLRAELVTLSACRSAGSRAYAGEGLVGLAWAFLSAGAGNVIGGLWNVEDASTSEVMEELYRGLGRGLGPAEALRAAKLSQLHSGTAYRKPFYWAPFVVFTQRGRSGEGQPAEGMRLTRRKA